MPRVKGGSPREAEVLVFAPIEGQVQLGCRASNGKPEIVVKSARPCSSRFTPVGEPIGRSGDFSSLARVLSTRSFRLGRMAILKNICDGIVGDSLLRPLFWHANPSALL